MNRRRDISLLMVTVLVCYLCFAHTSLVVRVVGFLVSIGLAIMAYCFFEHALLFRDKWKTATTGKRRTPPGQSIIAGSVFLLLAIATIIYCIRR